MLALTSELYYNTSAVTYSEGGERSCSHQRRLATRPHWQRRIKWSRFILHLILTFLTHWTSFSSSFSSSSSSPSPVSSACSSSVSSFFLICSFSFSFFCYCIYSFSSCKPSYRSTTQAHLLTLSLSVFRLLLLFAPVPLLLTLSLLTFLFFT